MLPKCPICHAQMQAYGATWSYTCSTCNHWIAKLEPNIVEADDVIFDNTDAIDSAIYFLDDIRRATSNIILDQLAVLGPGKLLDVGCAAGLFLQLAAQRGFDVQGIEPNKKMAAYSIKRGVPVHVGFFPDVLNADDRFEFITFNDVLEHIEDIHSTLESCHLFLKDDGFLTLNVPNCNGLFFRIAALLNRFGYSSPWNRLWQTMFYTPHLHYFSPRSLISAVERHGFKAVTGTVPLPVIGIRGLWNRLSADAGSSIINKVVQYVAVLAVYPVYKASTKDSFFVVFQKR